jgi:hypothetical protein
MNYSSATYRFDFANRVRNFVRDIYDGTYDGEYQVRFEGIIIWNEPNNEGMSAEAFVNLIHRCWKTFKDDHRFTNDMPKIYWGGIFMSIDPPYTSGLEYLSQCSSYLKSSGLMNGELKAFPWDGINVHVHRPRTSAIIHDILQTSKCTQIESGDPGELIVGEWGVLTLEDDPEDISAMSSDFRQQFYPESEGYLPDIMFYSSHSRSLDNAGEWVLRYSSNEVVKFPYLNGFLLNTYSLDPYTSSSNDQKARAMRNRYASIMGGTAI